MQDVHLFKKDAKKLEGRMTEYRDASNRLAIDFHNIEAFKYENITKRIVHKFDLKSLSSKVTRLRVHQ